MNADEWRCCTDLDALLAVLPAQRSDRQTALFGCACWRRLWHLVPNPVCRRLVELTEQLADGERAFPRLAKALRRWHHESDGVPARTLNREGQTMRRLGLWADQWGTPTPYGVRLACNGCLQAAEWIGPWAVETERRSLCDLIREVFTGLVRPSSFDPAWREHHGGAVLAVARSIYDQRTFSELPVLADALEDASCTDATLLGHLRGLAPHVRGCWALDLVLGRS
jgi:hypothetical protein